MRSGSGFRQVMVVTIAMAALPLPALAYENFDKGKNPPQLFMSDCGACHHSAAGLGAAMDPRALTNFLTEHYTASQDTATVLANYLVSLRGSGRAAPASHDGTPKSPVHHRAAKPHTQANPVEGRHHRPNAGHPAAAVTTRSAAASSAAAVN